MTSISFIIPSVNRPTLHRTVASIEALPGDEILVEFDIPSQKMWGNPQRNAAMARAKGDYLAFIDDDDFYVPGHRQIMADAIEANPDALTLFKMQYPNGDMLWKTPILAPGNIGSPMILVPNNDKIYHWKDGRNMADFIFADHWQGEIAWNEQVIAMLGHDDV